MKPAADALSRSNMHRVFGPVRRGAYSVNEVRQILKISRQTVYDLIEAGRLKSFKIGRLRRITRASVDAMLAAADEEKETV
jgi:excisionase family DNA binding protein